MGTQENDLKCYIVTDKESKEDYYYDNLGDWEGAYVQNGKFVYRNYKDPDTKESRSYEFYENLTKFLNIQENSLEDQLEGKYTYKFNYTNPYGIEVREKFNDPRDMNKEIESGPLFYLKSDQFGFSAPKDNKYPYDSYLEKTSKEAENKEKKQKAPKNNVAEWLYNTRSLGGSFLWPMEPDGKGGYQENPQYNNARGGTKNSAGDSKYYIEDRVDLTLLEIKQVMDYIGLDHPELEGNILWKCCLPETNMVRWLKHFKTFETYVKFFKLDIFVDKDKDYIPFDIVKANEDSIETTIYTGLNRPRSIWKSKTEEMDDKKLKDMFNYLSEKIVQRSGEMEKIIRG